MTRAKFNRDRAAAILADAEIKGDRETSLSWNVSVRTIENYRARLSCDNELVECFQKLRKLKQAAWIDEVPTVITAAMNYLKVGFASARYDAETIIAVTSAIDTLAGIELTRMLINKRFEDEDDADED